MSLHGAQQWKEAEAAWQELALTSSPFRGQSLYYLAEAISSQDRHRHALQILDRAKQILGKNTPKEVHIAAGRAAFLADDFVTALEQIEPFSIAPKEDKDDVVHLLGMILLHGKDQGLDLFQPWMAEVLGHSVNGRDTLAAYRAPNLAAASGRQLEADVRRLYEIAKNREIPLVLLTYFQSSWANQHLRSIAKKLGIRLVDQEKYLEKLSGTEAAWKKDEFFFSDFHCKGPANAITAALLFDAVSPVLTGQFD